MGVLAATGERVVGTERMWRDDQIAHARIVGQDGRHWCLRIPGAPPLVEHVSHGLSRKGATATGFGQSGFEFDSAVLSK